MAHISVSFNINGVAQNCFMVVRENSNLLVEVYRSALLTAPHSQREITVDNLNAVMHRVQIWTTLDDTTLNSLIGSCDIQATDDGGSTRLQFTQFVVDRGEDGDPVNGGNLYTADGVVTGRPDLDGATYLVFKPGYGALVFDVDIEMVPGGGWQFINGDVFSNGEGYTIVLLNTGTGATAPPAVGDITDVIDVVEDMAAEPNKLMAFDLPGTVGIVTMPDMTPLPDGTPFAFNTHQGSQINGEIAFQSGQGVYFMGSFRNRVFLGRGEELKLIIKSGKAYVISYQGCYQRVGERVLGDLSTKNNELLSDGTEYDGTIYKRIWEYLTTILPAGQKVTYVQFATTQTVQGVTGVFINRGFFAMDLANTKFKVPDTNNRSFRALKTGSDTERVTQEAGGYQQDAFKAHTHPYTYKQGKSDDNESGVSGGYVRDHNATGGNSYPDGVIITDVFGGTENRPTNIGLYPKIII